jgi:carboxyl-terminal processing protease
VIGVLSEGADAPREVSIVRQQIQTENVASRLIGNGIGYVQITHFRDEVGEETGNAIRDLAETNGGHLGGLVLDLRNNPGGVLRGAVSVSDLFLNEGLIVAAEGRSPSASFSHEARDGDLLLGAPLVVLINHGSASASEIVAGALQDHGRAVIMGETSFGKGTVQTIMPLSRGAAMKLTTARYITESGRTIQGAGITPDLDVTGEGIEVRDGAPLADRIREAWEAGTAPEGDDAGNDKALNHALRMINGMMTQQEAEAG